MGRTGTVRRAHEFTSKSHFDLISPSEELQEELQEGVIWAPWEGTAHA